MRLPILDMRNVLLALYGVVWAAFVVHKMVTGGEVNMNDLGAFGLGVSAILLAFRESSKPPPEGP